MNEEEKQLKMEMIEDLEAYQNNRFEKSTILETKINEMKEELELNNYAEYLNAVIQEAKEKIFKLSLFLNDQPVDYPEIEKIIEELEGDLILLLETKDELFSEPVAESNGYCGANVPNEEESVLEEDYCLMCGCDMDNEEAYEPDQDDDSDDCGCPYCKIEMLEGYIDELENENDELENENDELGAKVEYLEDKVDKLKDHIDYLVENSKIQEEDNENLFDENVNLIEQLQEKDREIEMFKGKGDIVLSIGGSLNKSNGEKLITNHEFIQKLINHMLKSV